MAQQNIFITGISSGLGYALAKKYLQQGAKVYGISRRRPDEALFNCGNLLYKAVDLADLKQTSRCTTQMFQEVKKIDIAILNAAIIGEIKDLKENNVVDMQQMMDINLWSNKVICDELFKLKIAIPQIVSISSGASINGNRGWGCYSISKAALNMLTKLYAEEVPETHFSSLAPGLIDTPMQDYLCAHKEVEKFTSLERLQQARGTDAMPNSEEVAAKLIEAFPKLLKLGSGSYADIRKL